MFRNFQLKHRQIICPDLFYAAAQAYRLTDRLHEAIRPIEEAIRAEPKNPKYRAELAAVRESWEKEDQPS